MDLRRPLSSRLRLDQSGRLGRVAQGWPRLSSSLPPEWAPATGGSSRSTRSGHRARPCSTMRSSTRRGRASDGWPSSSAGSLRRRSGRRSSQNTPAGSPWSWSSRRRTTCPRGSARSRAGRSPGGRATRSGAPGGRWAARSRVINADDFYGAGSFARLAAFLRNAEGARFAIVGFRLGNTLSENGTVSRGVCRVERGRLVSITEERAIARMEVGPGLRFTGEEIVSMNFWGFTPAVFGGLEAGLRAFLADRGSDPKAEFYLPAAVSELVAQGAASVDVLPSGRNGSASPTGTTGGGWPRRSGCSSPGARTPPGCSPEAAAIADRARAGGARPRWAAR
jgi:hypothetical protein